MSAFPTWEEQLRALDPVVDNLLAIWRPDGATEAEVQDMNKLALSILACGYLCHVYTDADARCSCRCGTTRSTRAVPTPTTCTSRREVDASGVYEITGFRGTSRFVEITQQQRRHA